MSQLGGHFSSSVVPEVSQLHYRMGNAYRLASDSCFLCLSRRNNPPEYHTIVQRGILPEAVSSNAPWMGRTCLFGRHQYSWQQNPCTFRRRDPHSPHSGLFRHLDSTRVSCAPSRRLDIDNLR
jgi:hypothetical protein